MSGFLKLLGVLAFIACGILVAGIVITRMRAESAVQQSTRTADDAAARALNCASGDKSACPP
ncbi:MAG TPA: hypothetical protein VF459_05855 [Caulobacteraceae bacterium]